MKKRFIAQARFRVGNARASERPTPTEWHVTFRSYPSRSENYHPSICGRSVPSGTGVRVHTTSVIPSRGVAWFKSRKDKLKAESPSRPDRHILHHLEALGWKVGICGDSTLPRAITVLPAIERETGCKSTTVKPPRT